jgi:hypothetical protein
MICAPTSNEGRIYEIDGRQRDSRIARQPDRVVRLICLRGVQHLLRQRVLPVRQSDCAASEYGGHLRGRLPGPPSRLMAVWPVCRSIRPPCRIDSLGDADGRRISRHRRPGRSCLAADRRDAFRHRLGPPRNGDAHEVLRRSRLTSGLPSGRGQLERRIHARSVSAGSPRPRTTSIWQKISLLPR